MWLAENGAGALVCCCFDPPCLRPPHKHKMQAGSIQAKNGSLERKPSDGLAISHVVIVCIQAAQALEQNGCHWPTSPVAEKMSGMKVSFPLLLCAHHSDVTFQHPVRNECG